MTDPSTLRDLLHRAVPDDAPALDPHEVAGAARRARRRTTVVLAGAAASVVAVAAVVSVATSGEDARDGDRVATEPRGAGTTAPYDVAQCPAELPELADADHSVETLDGLAAVRLCPDLGAGEALAGTPGSPTAADRALLAGMDALVHDVEGFARSVASTPSPDPARCATISVLNTRESLQLVYDDGRTALVPTPMCGDVTVAGQALDGHELAVLYLSALDRQRDALDYTRPFAGTLTCETGQVASPARPGREELVSAVLCVADAQPGGYGQDAERTGQPLDDTQLATLDAAWADPGDVTEDLNEWGENECTELQTRPLEILAATDRGDVVRLFESPCGYYVASSWSPGQTWAIPVTSADLGLG